MKKVTILRIITRLNIGGPAIHTVLLTAKLNPEKYESYLLTGRIEEHESDMMYLADKYNIKPIMIPEMSRELRPLRDIKSFCKIYKLLRVIKPNIVHTHTAKAGTVGRLAAFFAGTPIIIHTFHGNIFNGYFGKVKTTFFILLEKILAKFSTKIIALSKQQKAELVFLGIASNDKIKTINLGFQFENIIPKKEDEGVFRKQFGFANNATLIGIVGRLVPIKNHILFLDIAERICNKYDNIYFPIIGDGEMRALLENKVKERNLQNKIIFTGFIKDLKSVYADLDLVLLTSNNEGTPVAIIEAMACKKIVMSTKVGGVEDFIENEINGFYFPKGNVQLFVEKIECWLKNKNIFEEIGQTASHKIIKKFSFFRLKNNIEKLYDKVNQ